MKVCPKTYAQEVFCSPFLVFDDRYVYPCDALEDSKESPPDKQDHHKRQSTNRSILLEQ